MILATPEVHRALAFLAGVNAQGYTPTADELEAYATQPDRREARYESALTSTLALATSPFARLLVKVGDEETIVEHLLRLRWAHNRGGVIAVTRLGQAVLRALEQQTVDAGGIVDVVLRPDDPTALARAIDRISQLGPALLVEPYFRLDSLLSLVQATEVTRVLSSERTSEKDREILRLGVESIVLDRDFEVRVASRELHDRWVVSDSGDVWFIGSSLNSLGVVATAMGSIDDAAGDIRQFCEQTWNNATPLGRTQKPPPPPSAIAAPTTPPANPPSSHKTPVRKQSLSKKK